MNKVIGLVGFIGSGKGTVGNILVDEFDYKQESFANSLKDAVSLIFGWDRDLLEGVTNESRVWREQKDEWWSDRLHVKVTPRWALQVIGTDVFRHHFHDDIWIASLENRIRKANYNLVITDCRFFNEVTAIHNVGGQVIRILRGPEPHWWHLGISANLGNKVIKENAIIELEKLNIHVSEYGWVGAEFDMIVDNDGTVDDLKNKIRKCML